MSLKIYFGPYEAHGLIRHKTQKLYGVLSRLTELGYDVEIIPTNRLNVLTVNMRDKLIYRCDIRYLMFNMNFEDDPVAQNLVKCVEETRENFESEYNVPKFAPAGRNWSVETRDHLASDVSLLYEIPYSWCEVLGNNAKEHNQ